MRVESKLILMATKQEYSVISELTQTIKEYCETLNNCAYCPFDTFCEMSDDIVVDVLEKLLSEIQISS